MKGGGNDPIYLFFKEIVLKKILGGDIFLGSISGLDRSGAKL